MTIDISSTFDSGAIDVVATAEDSAELRIRHDLKSDGSRGEFLQWFHFRVSGAERSGAILQVTNAGESTYPGGWQDYRAMASVDRNRWLRMPTRFDGKVLTIELPPAPATYVAYFEPFSWDRHLALLADCVARGARQRRLGSSLQGRDLDELMIGQGVQPVWIIARQHPGETMAEWFVEGLMQRLLDPADAVARELRQMATFHIVPNMNPDGSVLGNLRTNAAGANLNREWLEPTPERSPEVRGRARCDPCERLRRVLRHPRRREPAVRLRGGLRNAARIQRPAGGRAGRVQRGLSRRRARTSRASTATRRASTRTTC